MNYLLHTSLVVSTLLISLTSPSAVGFSAEDVLPPCPGDMNDDDRVNGVDIVLFMGMYPCPQGICAADLNSDGEVNAEDVAFLLAHMGDSCE